jgi:hypothetical protein
MIPFKTRLRWLWIDLLCLRDDVICFFKGHRRNPRLRKCTRCWRDA